VKSHNWLNTYAVIYSESNRHPIKKMFRRLIPFLFLAFALTLASVRAKQQDPQNQQKKPEPEEEVIKVETNLVLLNVTVIDAESRYLSGLKPEDFKVFEDGVQQKIASFASEEMPFAGSILLDASGSMERKLTFARAACASFVEGIRDGDVFSIYKFGGTKVKLLQDFTQVRDIPDSVWDMKADSLTPLYDAIVTASEALSKREERKRAIILVSDGGDSNSRASLDDAIKQATNAGVAVYAVDLSDATVYKSAARDVGGEAMKTLTARTGGRFFRTPGGVTLRDAFVDTVDELRHQYTISYDSSNGKLDGKWRKIEVRIARPDLSIRTRQGYYARKKKG
jgi:Ca-activated chloride channel homolog